MTTVPYNVCPSTLPLLYTHSFSQNDCIKPKRDTLREKKDWWTIRYFSPLLFICMREKSCSPHPHYFYRPMTLQVQTVHSFKKRYFIHVQIEWKQVLVKVSQCYSFQYETRTSIIMMRVLQQFLHTGSACSN